MVNQPSVFPMPDDQEMTVAEAISMAHGFEKRAQKSNIGIIRMVDGKQTIITVDMNRLAKGKEPNIATAGPRHRLRAGDPQAGLVREDPPRAPGTHRRLVVSVGRN